MKLVSAPVARIGALIAAILVGSVGAWAEDNSRGVRIIEGPEAAPTPAPAQPTAPALTLPAPAPPQLATPAPALAPLVPPTSSLTPLVPPTSSLPPLVAPSEPTPQAVAPALAPPPESATIQPVPPASIVPSTPAPTASAPSNYDVMSLPPTPGNLRPPSPPINLPSLDTTIAVSNPAELSVEILPGPDIKVGSRVTFRVNTKKAGYLILVDVDSSGKLTQIFPNPMSLMTATSDRQNPHANFIKPGQPIQIPDPKAALMGGYEFVASPPLGTAMVVAILSDRPVQLIDLPDVPPSLVGQAAALAYLNKVAAELRVPPADGSGPLLEPKWSLDAKFYAIR